MRFLVLSAVVVFAVILPANEPPGGSKLFSNPDARRTLVNPNCSHCVDEAKRRAKDLQPSDRVLCWIRGKYDGGAIPHRFFLSRFPVISDTYGVFVHDADAGFVRGFEPSLKFSFHGWRNGVMVIQHEDGTLYSALTGVAFAGPNKGQKLKVIPTLETDWGFWIKSYQDTVAYHMFGQYKPMELPTKPTEASVQTRLPYDESRMEPEAFVLGVNDGGRATAFPLKDFGSHSRVFANKDMVIFWYAPTRTAVAYRSHRPFVIDDEIPQAPFLDGKPGSNWDIAGRAVAGPSTGKTLEWLDSVQVKWFAWKAEHSDSALVHIK